MNLLGEKWSVYKSYAQFKVFFEDITKKYPQVRFSVICNFIYFLKTYFAMTLPQLSVLAFPPSKLFGTKSQEFMERRRLLLEVNC